MSLVTCEHKMKSILYILIIFSVFKDYPGSVCSLTLRIICCSSYLVSKYQDSDSDSAQLACSQ